MSEGQVPDLSTFGEYLTVAEIASIMRVSRMTVYRLVNAKELTSKRIGRSFRVRTDEVERYLHEH
jgi:excisionase family DNA binding protein